MFILPDHLYLWHAIQHRLLLSKNVFICSIQFSTHLNDSFKLGVLFIQTVPGELYGPVMILFTLVALLLFSMKVSQHTVVRNLIVLITLTMASRNVVIFSRSSSVSPCVPVPLNFVVVAPGHVNSAQGDQAFCRKQ